MENVLSSEGVSASEAAKAKQEANTEERNPKAKGEIHTGAIAEAKEEINTEAPKANEKEEMNTEGTKAATAAAEVVPGFKVLGCRVKRLDEGKDDDEDEGYETPKSDENKIPDMPVCPLPPRKPKPRSRKLKEMLSASSFYSSLAGKRKHSDSDSDPVAFFRPTSEELELLFGQDSKANKKLYKKRKYIRDTAI